MVNDSPQQVQSRVNRGQYEPAIRRLRRGCQAPQWQERLHNGGMRVDIPWRPLPPCLRACKCFWEPMLRQKPCNELRVGLRRYSVHHQAESYRGLPVPS
jgi:hypothetical protein